VLVVRRRVGEAIVLGEDIEIEIVEISRTRVKLGVRAPRQVMVMRREAVAVAEENRRASDLLSRYGPEGFDGVLRLLNNSFADRLKPGVENADM
jgi:carbon storage regulator